MASSLVRLLPAFYAGDFDRQLGAEFDGGRVDRFTGGIGPERELISVAFAFVAVVAVELNVD
jgi:hypothetical protein